MTALTLIIGNKRYSSWSLRPWIAMKVAGIEFEDVVSPFDRATNHAHFSRFSPTKKVPVLQHDGDTVWDSLAILEYLAECFPEKTLWPEDRRVRAHARCVSSEMHSGFMALRNECPMNIARTPSALEVSDACRVDIARIEALMADCYARYQGPFLFGAFSIADAMFAPVVNRVMAYQLTDAPVVKRFCDAMTALPAWQEWVGASLAEPWICEEVEL